MIFYSSALSKAKERIMTEAEVRGFLNKRVTIVMTKMLAELTNRRLVKVTSEKAIFFFDPPTSKQLHPIGGTESIPLSDITGLLQED